MGRLLGPVDASARYTALPNGQPAVGKLAVFYAAATGPTLADIATYDGTATPGASVAASTLTVDADGLIPVWWMPDAVDVVWVSVNGGTRVRVSADSDARLDRINDSVVYLADHLAAGRVEGTTDDAAALTAALAALPASGGRIIWGRTAARIATAVSISKPVAVVGTHPAVSKITVTATKLIGCAASSVTFRDIGFYGSALPSGAALFNSDATTGDHSNWRFERCLFSDCGNVRFSKIGRMNSDGTTATTGTGVGADVALVDCELVGLRAAYGLEIAGVSGAEVRGCNLHNCGIDTSSGEGLKVLAGSNNVRIIGNHIHHNARDGIDTYDSNGVTMIGNDIHDNAVGGVEFKWANADVVRTGRVDRSICANNRIYDNAGTGINADQNLSVVTGNVVSGNGGSGIRIGSAFDAAAVPSERTTIANNVVTANAADGIRISNAGTQLSIVGNQAHENTGSGIALGASTASVCLIGNQAFDNTSRGISVLGTGHQLIGNRTQDDVDAHVDPTAVSIVRGGYLALTPPCSVDPNLGVSSVTMSANTTRYYRVRDAGTITKIGLEIVVSSGNIAVGIYSSTGGGTAAKPSTRLATSGLITCPSTGYAEVALGATVNVVPGDWFAVSPDNATVAFRSAGGTPTTTALTDGFAWAGGSNCPSPAGAVSSISGRLVVLVGVA